MRLHVEIVRSDNPKRQSHTFSSSPIRVGRSPLNNLVLSAAWVSQHHGVIAFDDDSITFTDLGSTNGTVSVVDGRERKVTASEPCSLVEPNGTLSTLRIGPIELRFERRPDEKLAGDRPVGRRDLSTRLTAGEVKAFRQEIQRPATPSSPIPVPSGSPPGGLPSPSYKAGGTRMVDSEEGRQVMKEVENLLRARDREASAPIAAPQPPPPLSAPPLSPPPLSAPPLSPPLAGFPPPVTGAPSGSGPHVAVLKGPGSVRPLGSAPVLDSAGFPILSPLPPLSGPLPEPVLAMGGEPPTALPPWPPLGGESPGFAEMPFDPKAAPAAFPDLASLSPSAWPALPLPPDLAGPASSPASPPPADVPIAPPPRPPSSSSSSSSSPPVPPEPIAPFPPVRAHSGPVPAPPASGSSAAPSASGSLPAPPPFSSESLPLPPVRQPPPPPPARGSAHASASATANAGSGAVGVIETPQHHRAPSVISGVLGRVIEMWKTAPGGPPRFDGPERAFVEMLAALADAFAQGLIEYKKGLKELGESLGVRAVGGHSPLHRSQSAGELLQYLLDPKADTHERLEQLVDLFADFMIHEVALLNGIKQGLGKLVKELDPEQGYRQNEGRGLAILDRSLKKYAAYFEGCTEDGGQRVVFGEAFARAYADSMGTAQTGEKRSR